MAVGPRCRWQQWEDGSNAVRKGRDSRLECCPRFAPLLKDSVHLLTVLLLMYTVSFAKDWNYAFVAEALDDRIGVVAVRQRKIDRGRLDSRCWKCVRYFDEKQVRIWISAVIFFDSEIRREPSVRMRL